MSCMKKATSPLFPAAAKLHNLACLYRLGLMAGGHTASMFASPNEILSMATQGVSLSTSVFMNFKSIKCRQFSFLEACAMFAEKDASCALRARKRQGTSLFFLTEEKHRIWVWDDGVSEAALTSRTARVVYLAHLSVANRHHCLRVRSGG